MSEARAAIRGARPARSPSRRRPPRAPAHRLVAMLVAMVVGLSAILVRLVDLQVRDSSAYQTLALDQRVRTIALPATRGTIFDRNGKELALSLPARAVYADPALVEEPARTAKAVAGALGLDAAGIREKLEARATPKDEPVRFVYLARQVPVEVARGLEERRLPGIGFLEESRRHYPGGAMVAPHVLGFVGIDGTGLAGLEYVHEGRLAGTAGHQVVEADPTGTLIPQATSQDVPPVPGDDLLLTIDRDIQYRAQVALAEAVRANRAKGGAVVVLDPGSGEVLAMAVHPAFDPNDPTEANPESVRNRAVTDVYEPGSVNKVITAAAALEEEAVGLRERLVVPDNLRLYDKVFRDAHPHAPQQMMLADIITHSSNVGSIMVAQRLGKERLYEYLRRFGFGRPTGIGFAGEASGLLAPPDEWWGTSMGTIPIGQGLAVTPLQMAAVYGTIANGGVWVRPRLVRGTVGVDGRPALQPPPPTRRVVSGRTATTVGRMLAHAVGFGTGTQAQIEGFWVAGKTGTARKPLEGGRGYGPEYVASFIGFVPASRPELVVAAVIDEPDTVFGGVAAAPLFGDVASFALARLQVPPAGKPIMPPHARPTG